MASLNGSQKQQEAFESAVALFFIVTWFVMAVYVMVSLF